MKCIYKLFAIIIFLFSSADKLTAQINPDDTIGKFKTIAVGPKYKKSSFYQSLWGRNYRKEWTTPVTFPVLKLDTEKGGMISYDEGKRKRVL